MPNFDVLRAITLLHFIVSSFVVLIFVAMYLYVNREQFFRWWSWAFLSYCASVFLSWVSLNLPLEWDWRRFAVVISLNVFALMQIPLILCGTEAVRTNDKRGRFPVWLMAGGAFALGVGLVLISRSYGAGTNVEYAIRTAPRHALLALTFIYSSWVFFRIGRTRTSRGAMFAAIACLIYAAVRAAWAIQLLPGIDLWEGNTLFYLDLTSILGFAVSAVLLMLERYTEARARLTLFEQILPTCSMCGIVRDDTGHEHGMGEWMELHEYMTRRTDTQLSHTFCPNCVELYKQDQGIA